MAVGMCIGLSLMGVVLLPLGVSILSVFQQIDTKTARAVSL